MLKNFRGFSLVEILIVGAIATGIGMVVMKLAQQGSSTSKQVESKYNSIYWKNEILKLLSNREICQQTILAANSGSTDLTNFFNNSDDLAVSTINNESGFPYPQHNIGSNREGLTLNQMELTWIGTPNEIGELRLDFSYQPTSQQVLSKSTVINLGFRRDPSDPNLFLDCRALGEGVSFDAQNQLDIKKEMCDTQKGKLVSITKAANYKFNGQFSEGDCQTDNLETCICRTQFHASIEDNYNIPAGQFSPPGGWSWPLDTSPSDYTQAVLPTNSEHTILISPVFTIPELLTSNGIAIAPNEPRWSTVRITAGLVWLSHDYDTPGRNDAATEALPPKKIHSEVICAKNGNFILLYGGVDSSTASDYNFGNSITGASASRFVGNWCNSSGFCSSRTRTQGYVLYDSAPTGHPWQPTRVSAEIDILGVPSETRCALSIYVRNYPWGGPQESWGPQPRLLIGPLGGTPNHFVRAHFTQYSDDSQFIR